MGPKFQMADSELSERYAERLRGRLQTEMERCQAEAQIRESIAREWGKVVGIQIGLDRAQHDRWLARIIIALFGFMTGLAFAGIAAWMSR